MPRTQPMHLYYVGLVYRDYHRTPIFDGHVVAPSKKEAIRKVKARYEYTNPHTGMKVKTTLYTCRRLDRVGKYRVRLEQVAWTE